jgi:hypothetical protein
MVMHDDPPSARLFKMGDHLFESFSDHLPLLRGRQLPRSSNLVAIPRMKRAASLQPFDYLARPAGLEPTTSWFAVGGNDITYCFYCVSNAARSPGLRLSFTVFYSESLKSPYCTDYITEPRNSDKRYA